MRQGIAGGGPDPGQNLDRLEDGEGDRSDDHHGEERGCALQWPRDDEPVGGHRRSRGLPAMKLLWWVVGITAFLIMLYNCALPGDLAVGRDRDNGLAGTYTVNGVDPTGIEYSGTVIITVAGHRMLVGATTVK